MTKRHIIYVFAGILLLSTFAGCSGKDSSSQKSDVLDFTLKDVNGNTKKFSELRGKAVIVNIWATWCGPCRFEIPAFIKLYEKYKDKRFEIWGVSVDVEGKKVVEPFMKEIRINYPIFISNNAEISKIFGYVRFLPTTFFFDADGRIVKKIEGVPSVKEETLESWFEKQILSILPKDSR